MVAEEFLMSSEQSTQDGCDFISCMVTLMQMPDYLYSVCRFNNTKIWNNSELNLLHTNNTAFLTFFLDKELNGELLLQVLRPNI
jgi:hypothetical protein